jgi:hypothetical protein
MLLHEAADDIAKPVASDLHTTAIQQAETKRAIYGYGKVFDETNTTPKVESKRVEKETPTPQPEEVYRQFDTEPAGIVNTRTAEIAQPNDVQQKAEEVPPPPKQPLNAPIITERHIADAVEAVDGKPLITDMELPQAAKPATETVLEAALFEATEAVASTDMAERAEEKIGKTFEAEEATQATSAVEAELETPMQDEASLPIAIPELPAPVVEIEYTIEQLVVVIEKDKAEAIEADGSGEVEAILEQIIALPTQFEAVAESDRDGAVPEEKLEALFVELFEKANISHSPELIESFVKLTQAHYLGDLLGMAARIHTETQDLPDEIGTREFLQKLQHGLSAMKQAVINFYKIGKSILRIYSYSFESATVAFD